MLARLTSPIERFRSLPPTVLAHDDDTDYPDETNWLPGELGEPYALFADSTLNIQVERSRVFPNGVIVTVTVRAPVARSREAQRSFGGEVISFHQGGHTGPRLNRRAPSNDTWTPVEPWGHGGTAGVYILPFWVVDVDSGQPLVLKFSWPGRSIHSEIHYAARELQAARSQARRLFN